MAEEAKVTPMHVVKRGGQREELTRAKILSRVEALREIEPVLRGTDAGKVTDLVVSGLFDGVTTERVDELCATKTAALGFQHPDYLVLAGRFRVSALHRTTPPTFSAAVARLRAATDPQGTAAPLVAAGLAAFVAANREAIDGLVERTRHRAFGLTYFAVATLERAYLLRTSGGAVVESPCYLWMRVALGVSSRDPAAPCLARALEVYDLLSRRLFTCATPTLFNAGTPRPQCSSCFLLAMEDDSVDGIFSTLAKCAKISKYAGGIGVSCSNIRAAGSYIRGTGGTSNGLVPMLRVFNETACWINQGGRRKGSFAFYLEPWHPDVFEFLELRKNQGIDKLRARDLFTALWVNDVFMRRVEADAPWSLICPDSAPDLIDLHGPEFTARYEQLEREPARVRRVVRARDVWAAIVDSQTETGTPYICYKHAANAKSNQQNLGCIRSSNLCAEVMQKSSKDETAVCNLASMVLPAFCGDDAFDFAWLEAAVAPVVRMLDRVIDLNFYPHESARRSNLRHRPVGLGIQGLADVFLKLGIPYASDEAVALGARIMETIYYAAVRTSTNLAEELGAYPTFRGSPASRGELQFDLWGRAAHVYENGRYGAEAWGALKRRTREVGLRNSLLVAVMPTASTSQICGSLCESIEPLRGSIFTRRTLAGEFAVINKYLVTELERAGHWDSTTRNLLAHDRGSAQRLPGLRRPEVYKTAWEMSQRWLIDHAAARGPFVCQSQSLNLYANEAMLEAGAQKISAMHFYSWRAGLKTGIYYLRSNPQDPTLQFTVNTTSAEAAAAPETAPEECLSCGA